MNSSRGALLKGTSKIAFIMSQYEVSDCIRLVRLLDFISLQYDEDGIFIAGRALGSPARDRLARTREESSNDHASTRDPKTGATGDENERRVDDGVRPRVGGVGIHGVGRVGGGIHGKV